MGIPWRAGREAGALREALAEPGAEWEGETLPPAHPIVHRAAATPAESGAVPAPGWHTPGAAVEGLVKPTRPPAASGVEPL
jgi:hypothetical protein